MKQYTSCVYLPRLNVKNLSQRLGNRLIRNFLAILMLRYCQTESDAMPFNTKITIHLNNTIKSLE